MACETAVVATATGGIPEVVVNGETGLLVPFESDGAGGARDPDQFAADIAERLNSVLVDPALAERMGEAGRRRAVDHFSWTAIAAETTALYAQLL
jgi:starch synthase